MSTLLLSDFARGGQMFAELLKQCLHAVGPRAQAFPHAGVLAHDQVVNLKAAVIKADWFDPELNRKIVAFAEHYQPVLLPTKPRTPWHKGKNEAGVKYAQNDALKGRTFNSLGEQAAFLSEWERNGGRQLPRLG